MSYKTEDLDDPQRFRLLITVHYNDIVSFVFEYLQKKSLLRLFFWSVCVIFLAFAISIRTRVAGNFPVNKILVHSLTGFIFLPLICIPVHEFLHVIPYYLSGAKNIRLGMDLRQYMFYVTAHRYVASPRQFKIVAVMPFLVISFILIVLIFTLPGLWKWSLSAFLFVHATMCAGDFALLNLYFTNRDKEIYTWDDADKKEAYFYEKIN